MTTAPSAAPRMIGPGVDVGRLTATVAELAADAYTGRRVGTAGSRVATAWLANRLRDLGAAVSTQEFQVPAIRELSAAPMLTWRGERLAHRRDFACHLASADPAPT